MRIIKIIAILTLIIIIETTVLIEKANATMIGDLLNWIKANSTVQTEGTDLPIVNIYGDINSLTYEKNEEKFILSYSDNKSDLNFEKNITMKLQGNMTLNSEKHNFNIKIYSDNSYSKKEKIDMGKGWGKSNKYCLKANVTDRTSARNVVTAKLAAQVNKKYGLFTDTPNYGVIDGYPVQVNVNDQFYGIYTWNIPKDKWTWNIDSDNIDNLALEGTDWTEQTYFRKEIEDNTKTLSELGWEIEEGNDSEENIKNKLNRILKFVSKSSDEEFKTDIEEYFNKDSLLNYIVMMWISYAKDNTGKNLIMVTYDGKIWYPTLYDLDLTYGIYINDGKDHKDISEGKWNDYFWNDTNGNLLFERVIKCFPNELAQRYFELRKNELSYNNIKKEFEVFCNQIPQNTYNNDYNKWKDAFLYGYYDLNQIYGNDESYLEIRLPFLDELIYSKYTITPEESEKYTIEDNQINNIQPTTKVKELKNNITTNAINIKVINNNGKEVSIDEQVETGMSIIFNEINRYTLIVNGDVNADGKADIKDILQINKHRLNRVKLTGELLKAADVNKDGKADIEDILKINKYRLGKMNEL